MRITATTLEPCYEDAALVMSALDMLEATAALIKPPPPDPDKPQDAQKMDLAGLARRAAELRDELRFILRANEPDYVYFLETRGRGLFLRAAPIDVSNILRDVLFDRMKATVLTSATLTVEGTFDYIRGRLGLEKSGATQFLKLPSEFDYKRQAILYLPRKMPDPRSVGIHGGRGAREIISILEATRGRAFVLFTSYAAMRAIQQIAEIELPYPDPRAGIRAALGAARAVPHDAECGAARDVELLAGGRRHGRGARAASSSTSCRSRRRAIRSRPRASKRLPIAAASRSASIRCRWPSWLCCRGLAVSSVIATIAACWRCSIRASRRWAMAGDFWRRCRRPPSRAISATSSAFSPGNRASPPFRVN